jgi:hypothetical protein
MPSLVLHHILRISLFFPPRFHVIKPLASFRPVCRDDTKIITCHIHCNDHMKCIGTQSTKDEIAAEVLIVWIYLNNLNCIDGF